MARRTAAVSRRPVSAGADRARALTAAVVAVLVGVLGLLSSASQPAYASAALSPAPFTTQAVAATGPPGAVETPAPPGATNVGPTNPDATHPGTTNPGGPAPAGPTAGSAAVGRDADQTREPGPEARGPHGRPSGTWPRLYADHSGTRHAAAPPGATLLPVPVVFTPPVGWRAPPTAPYTAPDTRHLTPYSGRAPPPPLGS
ncbi:hypothetical protein [Streptomyces buecherae]|uniref:Uncharacterized protein n=1 Tax=Streptomyces buecherae TaxID=2763006 RepID=A0A7H8NG40_9ACTN|nr:hypothetical protein [Streptomyces buecherae]QKW53432.1 hypothetical protein HUT08_32175 [Streptomyces buecherae]